MKKVYIFSQTHIALRYSIRGGNPSPHLRKYAIGVTDKAQQLKYSIHDGAVVTDVAFQAGK